MQNKFEILVHLVGFIWKEIYYDERSHEHKKPIFRNVIKLNMTLHTVSGHYVVTFSLSLVFLWPLSVVRFSLS